MAESGAKLWGPAVLLSTSADPALTPLQSCRNCQSWVQQVTTHLVSHVLLHSALPLADGESVVLCQQRKLCLSPAAVQEGTGKSHFFTSFLCSSVIQLMVAA